MEYYVRPQTSEVDVERMVARRLRGSMLWMVWGLSTTMIPMLALFFNPSWLRMAAHYYMPILFIELGVVFVFSMRQMSASVTSLKAMFFIYSILNGLTFAVISLAYRTDALFYAFIGTLAFFVSFAIIGNVVKRDLTALSSYLMAALFAMILVALAMMFFNLGSTWSLVLGIFGVVIFTLFTMVDVNRIKRNLIAYAAEDETVLDRIELVGALTLYLDFINLFLSLLRIFGRK